VEPREIVACTSKAGSGNPCELRGLAGSRNAWRYCEIADEAAVFPHRHGKRPVVAPGGTVTTSCVVVAERTMVVVPLNLTVFADGVAAESLSLERHLRPYRPAVRE